MFCFLPSLQLSLLSPPLRLAPLLRRRVHRSLYPRRRLTAEQAGSNTVQLSWTPVAGAVRYELRSWWEGAAGWTVIDNGGLSGTSFSHASLTAGRTVLLHRRGNRRQRRYWRLVGAGPSDITRSNTSANADRNCRGDENGRAELDRSIRRDQVRDKDLVDRRRGPGSLSVTGI